MFLASVLSLACLVAGAPAPPPEKLDTAPPKDLIVGKWEFPATPSVFRAEFTRDGDVTFAYRLESGWVQAKSKYTFLDASTVEIVSDLGNGFSSIPHKQEGRVEVTREQLKLKFKDSQAFTFRRSP